MKTFRGEIEKFQRKLKAHEPFGLSRFGDGELTIVKNQPFQYWEDTLSHECFGTGEFVFDSEDTDYLWKRDRLMESLRYRHAQYYIGTECASCAGCIRENFELTTQLSGQDDEHLTFAYVFVNANYQYYLEHVLPLYEQYEVFLVCNRKTNTDNLPFPIKKKFGIGWNAWKEDYGLIGEIKDHIQKGGISGELFLFCAGNFSCLLAHELHRFCPDNTYLDIGSTLDPFLFGLKSRAYLRGYADLQEVCTWE